MKYIRPARGASLQSTGKRTRRRFGTRRARTRGVSEVVATIILLAMTVVLFGSIFAWVTSFPTPAPQNVTQFSANFVLTSSGNAVAGLQITHLAGPSVPGSTLVYLKSAYHPSAPEFANPITAANYLPNPVIWNLGQTFNYSFPLAEQPVLPDNITILLVANGQLIYSTILPGTPIAVPPNFVAAGVSPASPTVGGAFTVSAVVAGNTGGATVYVTLSNIPGLSGPFPQAQKMTYTASTNRWTFVVPSGDTTANGTYYAFVNVTNSIGQTATAGVAVTLVSSGGGGGTPGSGLSVASVLNPNPPVLPGTSVAIGAVVTYLGNGQSLGLSLNFWVNQTSAPWLTQSTKLTGAAGLTISGPITETVYATTPATFSAWLLNAVVTVQAQATVATVGKAVGSSQFNTANLVTGTYGFSKAPPATFHSCTNTSAGTCPYVTAVVANGWLSTMSPAGTSVWVVGNIWINITGTISVHAVNSTQINAGATGTINSKYDWKPSAAGTFQITVVLAVSLTSGGTPIGWIWSSTSYVST